MSFIVISLIISLMTFLLSVYEQKQRSYLYYTTDINAGFIREDGRKFEMQSSEMIIGKSKAADLRIDLPDVTRKEAKKRLKDVDEFHVRVWKSGNRFYIQNITAYDWEICIIYDGTGRFLLRGESMELKSGSVINWQNTPGLELTFFRGENNIEGEM